MKITDPSLLKYIHSWPLWKITKENEIYLTFDDGPHLEYTISTLQKLKEFNARATFFLTGKKIIQYPGIVEKIIKEGHQVGNHGFSHIPLIFKKKKTIHKEIDSTSQAIKNITGEKPKLFRPPHGWFDLRFKKILLEKEMTQVEWNLLSYDFRDTDTEQLYHRVTSRMKPGDIVVFHDGHENAPVMLQTLPDILSRIKENNWTMSRIPL